MKTPIADMIEEMGAAGVAFDVIVAAVRAVETAGDDKKSEPTEHIGKMSIYRHPRRGARLSNDWQLADQGLVYATKRGLTPGQITIEVERFRNYWTAKSGTGATKLDWDATWRNWVLTAVERHHGATNNHGGRWGPQIARRAAAGADAVMAGMGKLAARIDERRESAKPENRQLQNGPDTSSEFDFERGGA
jgi:hypothetical protein